MSRFCPDCLAARVTGRDALGDPLCQCALGHWRATAVQVATEAYRVEQDLVAGFLADCCEPGPRYTVTVGALYDAYIEWAERNGEEPLNKKAFSMHLTARGLAKDRRPDAQRGRIWRGLRLRTDSDTFSGSPPEIPASRGVIRNMRPNLSEEPAATAQVASNGLRLQPLATSGAVFPRESKKTYGHTETVSESVRDTDAEPVQPADEAAPAVRIEPKLVTVDRGRLQELVDSGAPYADAVALAAVAEEPVAQGPPIPEDCVLCGKPTLRRAPDGRHLCSFCERRRPGGT